MCRNLGFMVSDAVYFTLLAPYQLWTVIKNMYVKTSFLLLTYIFFYGTCFLGWFLDLFCRFGLLGHVFSVFLLTCFPLFDFQVMLFLCFYWPVFHFLIFRSCFPWIFLDPFCCFGFSGHVFPWFFLTYFAILHF